MIYTWKEGKKYSWGRNVWRYSAPLSWCNFLLNHNWTALMNVH